MYLYRRPRTAHDPGAVASLPFEPDALLPWTPGFLLIFAMNASIAAAYRPLGALRWPLFLMIASAPALTPVTRDVPPLGILATVLTTLTCITCARLPSWDQRRTGAPLGRFDAFLWLTLPMVRSRPSSTALRRKNRRRALPYFGWALLKRLSWEPFAFLLREVDGDLVPWPVRSALLMLYFVLSLTAAADLVTGLCLLLGCDVEDLFSAPLLSVSPRDFWSRRWNRFISRFALKHVALPLGRRLGPASVLLAVFLVSGLFHEYFAWGVGGLSARMGLMTAFFLLQGGMVWLLSLVKKRPPPALGTALTFLWMTLTAPLFFAALEPALRAFDYPESYLPWPVTFGH